MVLFHYPNDMLESGADTNWFLDFGLVEIRGMNGCAFQGLGFRGCHLLFL